MNWLTGNTAENKKQGNGAQFHAGSVLLPVSEDPVWFEVEGIDDWSVVGNSWFDIGTPLLESLRNKKEQLEISERIRLARQILRDCARSLLRYRRRQQLRRKFHDEINRSIPTFLAAHKHTKQAAQHFTLPDPLQVIMGLFIVMTIFQSTILIHSMWTDHYERDFAYLFENSSTDGTH